MVQPPPIQLATLGWEDSLILMVLALVVFGPRRLPLIGRQIGKLMYEFRKASNDFKFQMEEELRASEEADRRKKEEAERQRVDALAAQSQASVSAPAQTVESVADIGAVETPTPPGYSATSEEETGVAKSEEFDGPPTVQPPSTGEQVSAAGSIGRSAYDIQASESSPANDVNPDADVTANAEEFTAAETAVEPATPAPGTAPRGVESTSGNASPSASGTSAKEIVSQHG